MHPPDSQERYARQLALPGFGTAGQQKLSAAKVLVVGAGGLGVPVLQYLAGMGIGHLGIMDGDVVGLSNLHRQILYTTAEVGQPKAVIAGKKLAALNPELTITVIRENLSVANALSVIAGYDVVVDACDNFPTRCLINDACVLLDKPFVYGAVHRFEGHLSVFNFEHGPTYRCLFPGSPSAAQTPDCAEAGVLGVVPGIIGCRQALEVVKMITGVGTTLAASLAIIDFLNNTETRITLKARAASRQIKALQPDYERVYSDPSLLSVEGLRRWIGERRAFLAVDVREPHEFQSAHLPGAVNIPLSTLAAAPPGRQPGMPIVVYCQRGTRSREAMGILQRNGNEDQIFSLEGGMDAWTKEAAGL